MKRDYGESVPFGLFLRQAEMVNIMRRFLKGLWNRASLLVAKSAVWCLTRSQGAERQGFLQKVSIGVIFLSNCLKRIWQYAKKD